MQLWIRYRYVHIFKCCHIFPWVCIIYRPDFTYYRDNLTQRSHNCAYMLCKNAHTNGATLQALSVPLFSSFRENEWEPLFDTFVPVTCGTRSFSWLFEVSGTTVREQQRANRRISTKDRTVFFFFNSILISCASRHVKIESKHFLCRKFFYFVLICRSYIFLDKISRRLSDFAMNRYAIQRDEDGK